MKSLQLKSLLLVFLYLPGSGIVSLYARPLYTSSEYNELYYDRYASNLYNQHLNRKYVEKKMETDDRIKELEDRIAENQRMIEQLIRDKNSLQLKSAAELAACQADFRRILSELDELKKKKAEDDRLAKLRIEDLENQITTIREKASGREKALLDEKQKSDERYLAEITRLKQELESARKGAATEKTALIADYEKKLSDLRTRIGKLEASLSALQAENTRLADSLEQERKTSLERQKQLDKLSEQQKSLEEKLSREIEMGEIRLKRFKDRLVINMDNKILFDSGSSELRSDQVKKTLDHISEILAKYSENRIVVMGHTDDVPIRTARFRDNWQLSAERALAVLAHILKNKDLNPARFVASGASEFQPLVPNNSDANRSLNRRVDIVVLPNLEER